MSMNNNQPCIDACSKCYQICLHTAMTHCLVTGGKHVEPEHFRLMVNCAQICKTSIDLQLTESAFCGNYHELCAEVCDACADSCAALNDMTVCEKACRDCAVSCRSMNHH